MSISASEGRTINVAVGSGGGASNRYPTTSYPSGPFTASAGGTTTVTRGAETLVSANGGNAGTGYFKSGTAVGGTGNGHGGGLRANGTAGVGYIFDDETLGLAGGGGGGGCSSGSASQIYSGAPFGARGSYAGTDGWTEYHAGIAGIGGGGGGGNGNSNTYATGSKGGNGAVYLRVHY